MPEPPLSAVSAFVRHALTFATRSLWAGRAEKQWALTGLGMGLLVIAVLPLGQIRIGAAQLRGLVGTYTGGSWQPLPCDVNGTLLTNPTYDTNGYLPMNVTQTVTATDTYPTDCDTPANSTISFGPNRVSNPAAFTAAGSAFSGYPGGGASTGVWAGDGVYYSPNMSSYALSNGSITENISSAFSTYYKWVYVGGTPPAAGMPGAAPPPGPLSLLVHTALSVSANCSSTDALLGATATVSDSLASSDLLVLSSHGSLTRDTYHLVQAGFGSAGIAPFLFTGIGTAFALDGIPTFTLNGGGYPTPIHGPASAYASTSLSAGSRLFTASLLAAATGQNLSTSPAFFFGPDCPVQGNAQAIGGSLTHVQLLIDGKVVQDQTPNGQNSSIGADFDSLNFAEGYNLSVTMQVWDSALNHYDCTLKAVVHLPQVQFYDLWTPDYTAAPVNGQVPQAAASTGGVIGGNTTLHLRAQYGALTLTEVRLHLHRDTDTSKDTVFAAPALASPTLTSVGPPATYSLWDARCGDPDPSLPASLPSQYVNLPWNVGGRNGVYDVTATFTAMGAGGVVHTLTSAATFDREDLLITNTVPANPTPLLWDPNANNGSPAPLPLSASFTCAYKAAGTATVKIYSLNTTPTNNNFVTNNLILVRTLTTAITTKDGSVSLPWNGVADPVSGQPGITQTKGIYLFQWIISNTNGADTDTDKSPYISPGNSLPTFEKISDDQTTAIYAVNYSFGSTYNRVASYGEVAAYNSQTLQKITSQAITGVGLTPGSRSVNLQASSPGSIGDYSFLVSIQDNHIDQDKGQRLRYALQQNPTLLNPLTVNINASGTEYPGIYQVAGIGNIPLPRRTIVPLKNGMKFSGTYCGLITASAFLGGLPGQLTFILDDKVEVNGTTVCEHEYEPEPGVRFSALSADFDSTHFGPNAIIFIRHTVVTTKGTFVYNFNDSAANLAYLIGNKHDLGPNAQLAVDQVSAIVKVKMNHSRSASLIDQKLAEIPVLLPAATAFYAYTHATQNAFADCYGEVAPVNPSHWIYANPQVNADNTPGNQTVQSLTALKNLPGQYLPPYWFVFLDGCSSAKSATLANEFRITGGADAAYLGWSADVPNRIFYVQWTKQLWNNLAAGMTIQEAVHQDNLKLGKFLGPNTQGVYPRAIIFGDPMMKLHGLYGTKGTKVWFRPTL